MIPFCLALAVGIPSDEAGALQSAHPRLALAMNIKEGGGADEFMEEVRFQVRLGLNGSVSSFKWSEIEPPQGDRDLKKITDYAGLLALTGAESAVTIQTIDTNNRTVPSDLPKEWDDPRTLARWVAFLSAIVPLFGPKVKHVSLGNEVDGYLVSHQDEVKGYKTFLAKGRDTIKRIRPDLKVGVTVMAQSFLTQPAWTRDLTQGQDVHFVTYYAMGDGFKIKDPQAISKDLAALASFDPSRPLIVQEIGMAASELLGGSEAKQAAFVKQIFTAFSGKCAHIPIVAWFMSTDFSPSLVDALQGYYQLKDPSFAAYLGTLGLKNHKGEPRLACRAFIEGSRMWIPDLSSGLP